MNKIKMIRLDSKEKFRVPDYKPICLFSEFSQITEEQLKKIIYSMQTKSYESDVIPTHFLKDLLDEFAAFVSKMINKSFGARTFCRILESCYSKNFG